MFPIPTPWKLGTIAFGVLSLALVGKVVLQNHQIHKLEDSLTLCQADLTTSRNNAATLEAALEDQNQSILILSAETQRRLAAAKVAVGEAQKRTRAAEQKVAVLQSRPINGDTLEERIKDVDARVLENLR